jgi:hypothetical protein
MDARPQHGVYFNLLESEFLIEEALPELHLAVHVKVLPTEGPLVLLPFENFLPTEDLNGLFNVEKLLGRLEADKAVFRVGFLLGIHVDTGDYSQQNFIVIRESLD